MICDGEKAVGIAGIMGGENSMITDDVKTMLLRQHALTVSTSENLKESRASYKMLPEI